MYYICKYMHKKYNEGREVKEKKKPEMRLEQKTRFRVMDHKFSYKFNNHQGKEENCSVTKYILFIS